jgi:ribosome-associated protein
MRGLDPEPIRAVLDAEADSARLDAARFRRAERWRDRLVDGGEGEIAEFVAECAMDRQELARLIAAARTERRSGKPAGAGKRLFRRVREALDERG